MLRSLLLSVLMAACIPAWADGFAVVPLRVDLGKNRTASLTVTNGDEAKTFEVRVMAWSQKNREDIYEVSSDLIAAPATFRVAKGATQVVRIALNRKLDATEHAYRLYVEEVPAAKEISPNSLKTVVSMAIPAFIAPASGPIARGEAKLSASLKDKVVSVEVANTGKANLKLLEWTLSSASGELLRIPSAAWVLSGNTLTANYTLKIEAKGALKLNLRTDRGSFSTNVAVR